MHMSAYNITCRDETHWRHGTTCRRISLRGVGEGLTVSGGWARSAGPSVGPAAGCGGGSIQGRPDAGLTCDDGSLIDC